jgi:hypothetical protein
MESISLIDSGPDVICGVASFSEPMRIGESYPLPTALQ